MRKILFSFFCVTVCSLWVFNACAQDIEGKVVIFHAGSLTVPLAEMEKQFEKKFPEVDVLREAGGSTKMARLIADVGKYADIMASADYKVIDNNLIPDFASWNVRFATNQMVLAYTENSRCADKINANNWYKILENNDVSWGHSDPNLDPCGYRSLMVLQLAEKFYDDSGLYDRLIANRPKKNIRPKSVELVNLLKTGNMDYAWEYRSVAVQHGLEFVTLDEHINLSNYKYDPFYKQAAVKVSGREPGEFITKRGKSITYGITMLEQSRNKPAAQAFLDFMLSRDEGLAILEKLGQSPYVPARISSENMLQNVPRLLWSKVVVKE
ncbi:MAG: tungstate ABC transporter substrate-binding protein WtpA [Thermodesulfobacteriota bacterium]